MGKMTNANAGTSWSIWDLHVHTPASIVQSYGGDNVNVWDKFIDDLETLPSDIRVVGINDYWFLDGYRKVLEYRKQGRLKNLDAIFPVIELRLSHFGGSNSSLSRINAHVIFDPEKLTADEIQAQFINALRYSVKLQPGETEPFSGLLTRGSLADLGARIRASMPEEMRQGLGSDLEVGFNNLNVSWDELQKALKDNSYLEGHCLIAMGKSEWNDFKWNKQSIAFKRDLINGSDVIFSALPDPSAWQDEVDKFREQEVNHKIIDCSDAHDFSDSASHMRIGNCSTWLNTTPTFAGLVYALSEFERRVFVGIEPPALGRVRRNPDNYVQRIHISSDDEEHGQFNYELELNPGFVAVVGNKGQGKSAFLDCIALAGNSSRQEEFAFLNKNRFLSPPNRKNAARYTSSITLASDNTLAKSLTDQLDSSLPVMVEYLPQAYVERICSVDPHDVHAELFEKELRDILFTHIPVQEREEESDFDALLDSKTRAIDNRISHLQGQLQQAIDRYVNKHEFLHENSVKDINHKIELKREALVTAESALDSAKDDLDTLDEGRTADPELLALRTRATEVTAEKEDAEKRLEGNEKEQSRLSRLIADAKSLMEEAHLAKGELDRLSAEISSLMEQSSDETSNLIQVTINVKAFEEWQNTQQDSISELQDKKRGYVEHIKQLESQSAKTQGSLARIDTQRERARQRVADAQQHIQVIKGSKDDPDSLEGLESLRANVEKAPDEIEKSRGQIFEVARDIFAEIQHKLEMVKTLYEPASVYIENSSVVRNAGLEFNAGLKVLPSWSSVEQALDKRKNGDLPEAVSHMMERIEPEDWEALRNALDSLLQRLNHDGADLTKAQRNPQAALKDSSSLAEVLFKIFGLKWLDVRFELTGNGVPLSQLSPGQRGLVLTLFYLVVDKRTTPLLLDQPEENLDNETIASRLVPAIHEAAERRQMIVVTHNANLAVVGDADQIVHCSIEDGAFKVTGGSISEETSAQFALNVLEGTKPAFDNRSVKYATIPQLG